ncbi:hypothetical protein QTO34_017266 [Cnephaeus nilssonii]|uniref:Uncharacterized protein n=1 Tax=Cnephaeus nilssonii TaxID=3371016 RepID=A0AA40I0S9_CNENI|nr:hypothetical protein QTO34_017266 [Eptesicus nilssonii]
MGSLTGFCGPGSCGLAHPEEAMRVQGRLLMDIRHLRMPALASQGRVAGGVASERSQPPAQAPREVGRHPLVVSAGHSARLNSQSPSRTPGTSGGDDGFRLERRRKNTPRKGVENSPHSKAHGQLQNPDLNIKLQQGSKRETSQTNEDLAPGVTPCSCRQSTTSATEGSDSKQSTEDEEQEEDESDNKQPEVTWGMVKKTFMLRLKPHDGWYHESVSGTMA